MKWFAWLCDNTLCWLCCNYLWAPAAYCLIIKRNYCHRQHQVLAARSDISHHACSWKSNDCCSMLLRSIQCCGLYSLLQCSRHFFFSLPKPLCRHVFLNAEVTHVCSYFKIQFAHYSSLHCLQSQAFTMNTCLLHFVAFEIFIEPQTEGESMRKKKWRLPKTALKILTQALQNWTVADLCREPETGSFQQ